LLTTVIRILRVFVVC